jgi:hypothetical protein
MMLSPNPQMQKQVADLHRLIRLQNRVILGLSSLFAVVVMTTIALINMTTADRFGSSERRRRRRRRRRRSTRGVGSVPVGGGISPISNREYKRRDPPTPSLLPPLSTITDDRSPGGSSCSQ